ncbi:MAG TPA: DNA-primase RepB domain-containing protein, partial [Kofleriaceae bacterium]
MTWYRMSDNERGERPAIPCSRDDAEYYNDPARQFGIFATVNEFNGPRRKDRLVRIRAWAIDIDAGTKEQMRAKLLASPLVPSLIVETKRGYQAYWVAKPPAQAEHWNAIVLERLVPRFGADKNARDLCRILRVPGYYHLKDPSDPFLVRVAWRHRVSYSERQMAEAFAWVGDPVAQRQAHDEARREAEREIREHAKQGAIAAGLAPTESL